MLTDLEMLAAVGAIHALKAQYFRFMDRRDWPAMSRLFTPDAVMDVRCEMELHHRSGLAEVAEGGLFEGRDSIMAMLATALEATTTVHHGHMPEIEILSATEAKGIWAMADLIVPPPGSSSRLLRGFGHYHERYRRDGDAGWRIAHLRLVRLHRTMVPAFTPNSYTRRQPEA